jgi:hypothetical protein
MSEQLDDSSDVAVVARPLSMWMRDVDQLVQGIERAAAGHGEPVDAEQLLTDFAEARDQSLRSLLASSHEPSPEDLEREDDASPELIIPTGYFHGLAGAWGLIRVIDRHGEPVDPEGLLEALTVALFADGGEPDAEPPGSFAAASLAAGGGPATSHARGLLQYRALLKRQGKGKGPYCCQSIWAPHRACAADKQLRIGRRHKPYKLVPADPPSTRIRCGDYNLDPCVKTRKKVRCHNRH